MIRGSLRLRLLTATALWATVALMLAAVALSQLFRRYTETEAYYDMTDDQEQIIAGLTIEPDGALSVLERISNPQFSKPYSGFYWQVVDMATNTTLRSRSLWDKTLPLPALTVPISELQYHKLPGFQGSQGRTTV